MPDNPELARTGPNTTQPRSCAGGADRLTAGGAARIFEEMWLSAELELEEMRNAGVIVSEAEVEAACTSIWGHLWAYSPIVEASRRSELRTALEAAAKVREGK